MSPAAPLAVILLVLLNAIAVIVALGWEERLLGWRPRWPRRRPAAPAPFDRILAESVEPEYEPRPAPPAPRTGPAEERLAEDLERWRRGGTSAAGTPIVRPAPRKRAAAPAATPCRPRRKSAAPRAKSATAPRKRRGTAVEVILAPETVA
jgi:hypothetical protein